LVKSFRCRAAISHCQAPAHGSRVSLRLAQWDGSRFKNVRRKGNVRTKLRYLPPDGRKLLEAYLEGERPKDEVDADDDWLFLGFRGGVLSRRQVHKVLI